MKIFYNQNLPQLKKKFIGNNTNMANLTKTKTLFGFTSPRTLEKIIPEIGILVDNFSNLKWSGNKDLQIAFFDKLFQSEFYEGESYPSTPDLAARDRITRAPKALGFVDLKPAIKLTEIGKKLLDEKRLDETFTRQLLKFQLISKNLRYFLFLFQFIFSKSPSRSNSYPCHRKSKNLSKS